MLIDFSYLYLLEPTFPYNPFIEWLRRLGKKQAGSVYYLGSFWIKL